MSNRFSGINSMVRSSSNLDVPAEGGSPGGKPPGGKQIIDHHKFISSGEVFIPEGTTKIEIQATGAGGVGGWGSSGDYVQSNPIFIGYGGGGGGGGYCETCLDRDDFSGYDTVNIESSTGTVTVSLSLKDSSGPIAILNVVSAIGGGDGGSSPPLASMPPEPSPVPGGSCGTGSVMEGSGFTVDGGDGDDGLSPHVHTDHVIRTSKGGKSFMGNGGNSNIRGYPSRHAPGLDGYNGGGGSGGAGGYGGGYPGGAGGQGFALVRFFR